MVTGCTVTPLFDALAALHQAYGGVEITLAEGSSASLAAGVRAGEIDLALVGVAGDGTGRRRVVHCCQRASGRGGSVRSPAP